jgi:hypothetical protein
MVDDERLNTPAPPRGDERPRTPLWVKVSGGVGLAAVVVFVVLHLTGNGMIGH